METAKQIEVRGNVWLAGRTVHGKFYPRKHPIPTDQIRVNPSKSE